MAHHWHESIYSFVPIEILRARLIVKEDAHIGIEILYGIVKAGTHTMCKPNTRSLTT